MHGCYGKQVINYLFALSIHYLTVRLANVSYKTLAILKTFAVIFIFCKQARK